MAKHRLGNAQNEYFEIEQPDNAGASKITSTELISKATPVANRQALIARVGTFDGEAVWQSDIGLMYIWKSSGVIENGGTQIGTGAGWVASYIGAVNVKWFGAKGNGHNNSNIIKGVIENFKHVEGDTDTIYTVVTTDYGDTNRGGVLIQSDSIIEKLNIHCTGNVPDGDLHKIPSLFEIRDGENIVIRNCKFSSSSELDARTTSSEKGVYTYIGISSSVDFGSNNILIKDNTFTRNLGACIGGLSSYSDGLEYYKSNIVVTGNHFFDVGGHCFGMQKGYRNIVSNNTMNNQIGAQFTGYVVGLFCDFSQGTSDSICDNNICTGVQSGIKTESDGYLHNYSQHNIISNNIFKDFKGEGASTSNYGIQLNGIYDSAFGNKIYLGVNPTTGTSTSTLITGIKTQSGSYKCLIDGNTVVTNGSGIWCFTSSEPSNLSYLKITNNSVSCQAELAIQLINTRNAKISDNILYGTSNLISLMGNNFLITGNSLYTSSPSVGAIYLNEQTINIEAYVFTIVGNRIDVGVSGPALNFNTTPSSPYKKVNISGNIITSKADGSVLQLYSTDELIFSGNSVSIDNPDQTADRRCLMLSSSSYVCTNAVISNNTLHNNGTDYGNAIYGKFTSSLICNNSLLSHSACVNLNNGENTAISGNSWKGSAVVANLGTDSVSQNNIEKL